MSTPSVDLILQFMGQNAGMITGFFLINFITLGLDTVILSIVLSKIFSALGTKGNGKSADLWHYLKWFVVIFVLIRLGYFARNMMYNEIIPEFFYFLRTYIYNKIIDRYRVDFKELNLGYVLFNFEHLPTSFKRLMTELLQEYIPNILALLVCIIYLFAVELKAAKTAWVGSIVLIGTVLFIGTMFGTLTKSIDLSADEHAAFEYDNEYIQDRLNNLFDIYTSGTEIHEKQEYDTNETDLKKTMIVNYEHVTKVTSIIEVFTILVLVASLLALYRAYNKKTIGNEQIISIILVLTYFLSYFSKITNDYIGLTDVFGYSKESDRFLNEINGSTVPTNVHPPWPTGVPVTLPPNIPIVSPSPQGALRGPIEFKNVSFKYPGDKISPKKILNNVNLYIKPGSKIAIFGRSGSGKSTLVKLLLGFYTMDSGAITIGGADIKGIGVDTLRKNVAVVN